MWARHPWVLGGCLLGAEGSRRRSPSAGLYLRGVGWLAPSRAGTRQQECEDLWVWCHHVPPLLPLLGPLDLRWPSAAGQAALAQGSQPASG